MSQALRHNHFFPTGSLALQRKKFRGVFFILQFLLCLLLKMKWFLCVVLVLMVWPFSSIYSSPVSINQEPQEVMDCPSGCALVYYHRNSSEFPQISVPRAQDEQDMTSRELNPQHYEASRAGRAIQHYINTIHGSPFRLYSVNRVYKAKVEDMAEAGMKYTLEFSVKDIVGESPEIQCSAEVLYPRAETHQPPQVMCSCIGLPHVNTSNQEQAFYQRYSVLNNAVSAKDIPDSYGHIDPDMFPFWHLGTLASSSIMLNESNENTLYGMVQVAKVNQLNTEDDQLRFEFEVLLHDMVSQEIIRWKLQITWSPGKGVKLLESELLPKCHCQ